ncbi:MAG: PDZ domain-containing protein [Sphingomonas sp.]
MRARSTAFLGFLLVGGSALASAAPSLSPQAVLAAARQSAGRLAAGSASILESHGRVSAAGLNGDTSNAVALASGRFTRRDDFGVYARGWYFDGHAILRTDPSGGVHALTGAFATRQGITDAWLARRAYLAPDAGGAAIDAAPSRAVGGRQFDIVKATPKGGQQVELWFDSATHLLARDVRIGSTSTTTESFDDYRPYGGTKLAFRVTTQSDASSDKEIVQIDRFTTKTGVFDHMFAPPTTRRDAVLAAPTAVPTKIGKTMIVVEAMLNGHGPYGFILDTGGHNILTPEAAAELGLRGVGGAASGGAGAGLLTQQDTTVDKVEIGAATLSKQHFYVIPLQYGTVERGTRAPLAGIIGLELFERFAVHIDYRGGKLDLIPFDQADGRCEGRKIPFGFDDDMPLVEGAIEGKSGALAIDSGNGGSTVVQGHWADRVGLAARLRRGIETTSFGSGGSSTNWLTHDGNLALADESVAGVDLRLANDTKGSFSSITEAANVGQQVLARYSVLFDYSRNRMCLKPVPGYVAPPLNRSGVFTTKIDADHFMVASVSAGSPAAKAAIKAGDRIIGVNGRPAGQLSGADLYDIVRQAPGTIVRMTVERDKVKSERTLTLEEAHS